MLKKRLLLAFRWIIMLIIYAGLWAYTLFQGDTASWFLTYFFSFILLILFLSSIYPLKAWKVHRNFVKNTYHDGDLVDMHVSFSRKSRYPVGYLLFQQKIPVSFGQVSARQQVVYPLFKKNFTVKLTGFIGVRGIHYFPPLDLETSDAFGILERTRQMSSEKPLTIYPTYFPDVLEKISEVSPENERNAAYWTLKKNSNIHSLREFSSGDRIALIDWKSSAKSNQLMTREFENSATSRLSVIFYGANHPNFELSLRAAYSFIRKISEDNGEIRVTILGDQIRKFAPAKGTNHLHEIAKTFAELAPVESLELQNSLDSNLHSGEKIFLFTPDIDAMLMQKVTRLTDNKQLQIITIQSDYPTASDVPAVFLNPASLLSRWERENR
ncbi:DUF58 domain-containing protein [Listeria welshimeri]|uniref:DUF58 domain-containing protein n=1 Tax=Listeria welshimeri TaxID=1643 RepID=UPI00162A0DEE|nr:DUF58 domain-containing protein [Listeria welshimeri]MBC1242536.1 DUF58 domain-containing protein [Listeria welshimeri]MBC1454582.1 DUF58 domain-containing protein [Listeria welshimeri]MBC1655838.1 DUF58 domain-containing protein [Listeria welshimeri]MBC1698794.1 DUF58 domain-containing protein [Listeria welshimeri]MBC1703294.1 DUF58 domain-containing protein [Listeria welshimeri]